jgi:hypothetical protein
MHKKHDVKAEWAEPGLLERLDLISSMHYHSSSHLSSSSLINILNLSRPAQPDAALQALHCLPAAKQLKAPSDNVS